jgi:hypothetical protein
MPHGSSRAAGAAARGDLRHLAAAGAAYNAPMCVVSGHAVGAPA